jgi:endonuclease YncB( thermonuclease family)
MLGGRRFVAIMVLPLILSLTLWGSAAAEDGCEEGDGHVAVEGATVRVSAPVRVIEGDTLDVNVEGERTGVGLIGISAPPGNTACGREAIAQLRLLAHDGIDLVEDASIVFDERGRRMYYAFTPDGRSIALELVQAGVVRADGTGREAQQLAEAGAEARAAQRGCLWTS